jgi:hypothetical protein
VLANRIHGVISTIAGDAPDPATARIDAIEERVRRLELLTNRFRRLG